jgi:hypothetical protein
MNPASISPRHVLEALRNIRRGHPGYDSPLLELRCLRNRLQADGRPESAEELWNELGELMHELATDSLRQLRRQAGIQPPRGKVSAYENAVADLRSQHLTLGAMSVMYYTFLDPSAELRPQQLQAVLRDRAVRTLQRQLQHGVNQLTRLLRDVEAEAVASAGREYRNLPPPSYTRLFGVDHQLAKLQDVFKNHSAAWIVSVEGMGGVGKTALVLEASRRVTQLGLYADVVWETARQVDFTWEAMKRHELPALTLPAAVDSIARQLGYPRLAQLPSAERLDALRAVLRRRAYLIVVDNIESAFGFDEIVGELAGLANPSQIVLTSRVRLGRFEQIHTLELTGLAEPDSIEFMRYHARERGLATVAGARHEELAEIHAATSGNPLAMKLVVGQLRARPIHSVLADLSSATGSTDDLYTFLYEYAWDRLAPDARKVLMAMAHLPESGATLGQVVAVCGLPDSTSSNSLLQLVDLSLVTVSGSVSEPTFSIHPLTRNLILTNVAASWA